MEQIATKLSPKQARALEALLSEATQEAAAHKAGVSRTTLFRWLQETDFREAYDEAIKSTFDAVTKSLQSVSVVAVAALRAVLDDAKTPPAARVAAIRCALEFSLKIRDQQEILARLQGIEERLTREGKK